MTKSRTKKTLIVTLTSLFIGGLFTYKINHDYHFAKKLNMSVLVQNVFWNHDVMTEEFGERADAYDFHTNGGGPMETPTSEDFTLDLNDQYKARYSYWYDRNPNRAYKDVFNILVVNKSDNVGVPDFDFWVNKEDFKIIKDDSKFSPMFIRTPEAQKKVDAQMTPEVIKETEELKKLAIKRFKEAQDKYYKSKN